MKYQGIIFDLDGVICSTDELHYTAWKETADSIGVYFDREINNLLRGVSRMESLEIILRDCGKEYTQEEKELLATQKNELYKKLLEKMTPADLSAEVKDTLDILRSMNLKLAIGSSSKNAKMILSRLGLNNYFDAVSDGTNISRSKPDPEVFIKAADMLNLPPAECLVVEDARSGIEAALAGGFTSAGLGEAASHEGTAYPLSSFSDLAAIFGRSA